MRGHAGGEDQGVLRAAELAELALDLDPGGIRIPAVTSRRYGTVVQTGLHVLRVVEVVRRALVGRRLDAVGVRVLRTLLGHGGSLWAPLRQVAAVHGQHWILMTSQYRAALYCLE